MKNFIGVCFNLAAEALKHKLAAFYFTLKETEPQGEIQFDQVKYKLLR